MKKAKDLGLQFLKNDHQMIGQDGAYSIPLNGDTLWFFGDTLIGKRLADESLWYIDGEPVGGLDMSGKGGIKRMITNTGLILKDDSGIGGLNDFHYILDNHGQLKNLIELYPNEDPNKIRIWCQHGISLGNVVYLSFIKVEMYEKPKNGLPVEFEILGSGFARGVVDSWEFTRIENQDSDLWWGKKDPRFASAIYKEDQWIYCYGVKQSKDKIQYCYLAKVKPDAIENLHSYEYFSSADSVWDKNIQNAIPIFSDVPNELSVSYNRYLEKYLAVHSYGLSGKIIGRTADYPWGPWSDAVQLWQVSTEHQKPLPYPKLIYAGKEHVELSRDNGNIIYITYIEFEEYYPHLIEITLDKAV